MHDDHAPQLHTIVIGGGQAGLAVAHALQTRLVAARHHASDTSRLPDAWMRTEASLLPAEPLVLEARDRLGDVWRDRWDSLALFTPARHDGLPGLGFPAPPNSMPGKDAVAAYHQSYADRWGINIRTGTLVSRVNATPDGWQVTIAGPAGGPIAGPAVFLTENVVVATGSHTVPHVPAIADQLDSSITQLHTADYRRPSQLDDGPVLVVGAGTSGAQIARELAHTRPVTLAGRPTPHVPAAALRYAGGAYWRFINDVLTRSTPLGRRAAVGFTQRGAPLIGISPRDIEAAGVARVGRIERVDEGWPVTEDGQRLRPSTIVWATGYHPDFEFIDGLPLRQDGWPDQDRGVLPDLPGLYFVGLPFQYALTSALIGGVGRDAEYVADHIVHRSGSRLPA